MVSTVRNEVAGQPGQLGGQVPVGQYTGRDHYLADGYRRPVRECHPEFPICRGHFGDGVLLDPRHQSLGVPVRVVEEPITRERAHPVDVIEPVRPAVRRYVVFAVRRGDCRCVWLRFHKHAVRHMRPPGVHGATHDHVINAKRTQMRGDRKAEWPGPDDGNLTI